MARPLYDHGTEAQYRPKVSNAGLWYDKFCDTWSCTDGSWSLTAKKDGQQSTSHPKLDWIRNLTQSVVGDKELLGEHSVRVIALVEARRGSWGTFRTASRLVSGLGRSHPIELGFAWHHNLGVPYLAGSSIKGLVRAWTQFQPDHAPDKTLVARLLGDEGTQSAGEIVFFDSVPTEPVKLEADVLTPHYGGWTVADPPGDWRSPTPIPFLAVATGQKFLFAVANRVPGADESSVRTAFGWLQEALGWLGAGAKTALGYGRLVRDEQAEARLRDQYSRARPQKRPVSEPLQALSPLEQELQQLVREHRGPNVKPYVIWLQHLTAGRWTGRQEERSVAEKIRQAMAEAGAWRPTSSRKNPAKDQDHQRTLTLMKYLGGEAQ